MPRRIVLLCPDIALKGCNRRDFEQALLGSVRRVLGGLGVHPRIGVSRGRLHVDVTGIPPAADGEVIAALACVPGIATLGAAEWLPPGSLGRDAATFNWAPVENAIVDLAGDVFEPGLSFAVNVKRLDRKLSTDSVAMERRLGAVIRDRTGWDRVDLGRPDREFHVDAAADGFYLYRAKLPGIGGLPVGTLGRVLALLSGGIDSPVASFLLAKRGCSVDALHVTAGALEGFDPVSAQVVRLAARLSRYTQRTRLYVVPDIHFDLALRGRLSGHGPVLFRRFLLRAGEALARRLHAAALVMGDSLGQVASQTLENINATSAATTMTVFRPLIGFNKPEIIALARRLGTYDISNESHRDCCTLLSENPRTRTPAVRAAALESQLIPDYDALLERTCTQMLRLEFNCGRLTDTRTLAGGMAGP